MFFCGTAFKTGANPNGKQEAVAVLNEIIMSHDNPEYYALILRNNKYFEFWLVLRPGFEPGSATREAAILDRTILPEHKFEQ